MDKKFGSWIDQNFICTFFLKDIFKIQLVCRSKYFLFCGNSSIFIEGSKMIHSKILGQTIKFI
ncbi:hypothetical protein LEP1GSC172_2044 [Leptospira noguchii]|uniref:Uncharacterized protein n=2 Tax=Leptospira noguchii TaxID=28182 RepID=T0GW13_9LEPT|nr:hypothetical protein LEP1GSC172_2044 [Leptospira noguchii]EQA73112.1 hypothetical protein LEP1GSC059_1655 [Leptospira noguchii serovar Panama str. CZ214]